MRGPLRAKLRLRDLETIPLSALSSYSPLVRAHCGSCIQPLLSRPLLACPSGCTSFTAEVFATLQSGIAPGTPVPDPVEPQRKLSPATGTCCPPLRSRGTQDA